MSTSQSVNSAPLPRPVQRQIRRMNDLIKERGAADEPVPAETPAPAPGVAAETTPPPAPEPQTPPAKADEETADYWKQRFKVTDGMFRAQREKHASELAQRDSRIAELEGEVARISSTQGSEAAAPDPSKFLSAEQIEALGEEQASAMVSAAVKAARDQVQATVDAKLKPFEDRAKKDQEADVRRKVVAFEDALTDAVPEWRELNEDPRFLAWLTEADEATGMTRQDVATLSGQRLDPKPTLRLLREFKAGLKAAHVPAAPPVSATATGNEGGTTPQPQIAEGAPTAAEIKEHFKLRALRKLKNDEIQKFDARLKAAELSRRG